MPYLCCVPNCNGNYPDGPKVSCFSFPKDLESQRKWLDAIKRGYFTPTKTSRVCELHFESDDIERITSCEVLSTGEILSCPLKYPRIKKGAVPSKVPECTENLSKGEKCSRLALEQKKGHKEHEYLRKTSAKSLENKKISSPTPDLGLNSKDKVPEAQNMIKMAVKCVFCKEPIDWPIRHRLKDVRMYMFKKIMKKHFFSKQQLLHCPLCNDCDNTLQNFYNCKADIASTNEDFLNYMDSNDKVDLYKALVVMEKLKRFEDESIAVKVCRICFKATQDANYREVKSWNGDFAKMIMLCLPEFDVNLTDHTYFCPECYSKLLQYNHFLSLCLKVTNTKKRQLDNPDPLELTPNDLKEKRQKMDSNVVKETVTAEPLPVATLLIPAVPKKRGRPRKEKEINKPNPKQKPSKKISKVTKKKEKNYEKNNEEVWYDCQVCSKVLSNLQGLNEHMGKHRNETKFLCPNCGFFCSTFQELKDHFLGHQMGLYRIIRDSQQDSEIAKNVQVLKDNILKQKEKKKTIPLTRDFKDDTPCYECQICPGVFYNIEILRDHINGHKLSHSFKCWKCGKETYSFESFRQHFLTHGFINIYKTKFTGNNSPSNKESSLSKERSLNKESSKDVVKKPVSPAKSLIGVTCATCKETMNNLEQYLDHSCPSPSKSTSDISCTSCSLKLDNLDDYINHSCSNKQQFSCGHCSKMFYSLDDLDEHNCNVSKRSEAVRNKSKSDKVPSSTIVSNTSLQDTPAKTPTMPSPIRNSDPEYECSYCLKSFNTVTALDVHSCTGEPDSAPAATESRSLPEIKTEKLHGCNVCMSVCESEQELRLHKCSESVDNGLEDIILLSDSHALKTENFDIENDLSGHEKAIEPDNNTNEDIGNDIKTEEIDLAATQKKALVNKIAGVFGVKIVEGSEKKSQNTLEKLKCDGCGLKCHDENDLIFHFKYYCSRARKCDFCSYKTDVVQKLEIHNFKAHNLEIFACLHCRFTTYMEENFKLHITTHNNAKKTNTSEEINLERNPKPNIILNYTDAVRRTFDPLAPNSCDKNTRNIETNLVIKSNFINKNLPQTPHESLLPEENNELIIPDIVEKDPLLLETQDETFNENSNSSTITSNTLPNYSLIDPLGDIEPQTDNISNDYLKSSTLPEGGDTTENSHIEQQEKDQDPDKHLYEETTIVIDDDSDSEFVESTESRISVSATQVEGIYPVTSSEASKLISEGVPVLREDSFQASDKIRIISNVLSVVKDNDNTLNSTDFNNCITTLNNAENNLVESTPDISSEATHSASKKENKSLRKYGKKQNVSDVKPAPAVSRGIPVEDKAEESDGSSFFVTDSEDSNPASLKDDAVVAEDSFLISDDEENVAAKPSESKNVEDNNSDVLKQLVSALEINNSSPNKNGEVVTASSKDGENKCEKPNNKVLLSNENVNDGKVRSRSGSSSSVELSRDFSKEVEDKEEHTEEDSGDDCIFVSEVNDQSNIVSSSGSGQKGNVFGKKKSLSNDNIPEKVKRPPNALQIFMFKAKSEMEKKYPHLNLGKQKTIIMNAWKILTPKQKWPFREEARLHKLLFKREHPELDKRKKRINPVNRPQEVTVEEIILD